MISSTLRQVFVATAALAFASVGVSAAFEGRVSMSVKEGRGKEMVIDYAMKPGFVRMEPKMDEGEQGVMIFNHAKQEMIMLMPTERMYMVMPIKETLEKAAEKAPEGKIEKTGRTETIQGYACEEWVVTDPKGERTEMWVTDQLGNFMGISAGQGPMGGGKGGSPAWERLIKGKDAFFPMRVIGTKGGKETYRMEVKAVNKTSLPDSLFGPPAGFQKFAMPGFPGMPGM
jgi:hypothetical protein